MARNQRGLPSSFNIDIPRPEVAPEGPVELGDYLDEVETSPPAPKVAAHGSVPKVGASSVVASLWKVDDEATAELMKHFYGNMLQKGMRPAEALRAAQNTLRQDPHWRSPHFWAGFTLQGEFNQPIGVPTKGFTSLTVQRAVGAGLLLILLTVIAWGFWRKRATKNTR